MTDTSADNPARPSAGGLLTRAMSLGAAAGLATGALDMALTVSSAEFPARDTAPYLLALTTLGGAAAGVALGLLLVVGAVIRNAIGWRSAVLLPVAIAAAFLWVKFNGALFDGPWIRQQGWAGSARLAGVYGGAFAVFCALLWSVRAARWGFGRRALAAVCMIAIAGGAAWVNLEYFGTYPTLKLELTLITWVALFLAAFLVIASWRPRPWLGVLAFVVLGAAATWFAVDSRKSANIHRVRGSISGVPMAAGSRLMVPIERALLDRLAPVKGLMNVVDDGAEIVSSADLTEVQRRLDDLVPNRRRMNVLWIAVDALRADHLGCYGYERPTSPEIDALSRESVRFERAVTPTPASNFAYSATLTGLAGRVSPSYYDYYELYDPSPEDFPLAAQLGRSGRATVGVTSFFKSVQDRRSFTGFRRGFEVFNALDHADERTAPEITDRGLQLLEELKSRDRGFFLWLHYIDPHGPYTDHAEFSFGPSATDAYDSEIKFCDREIGRLLDGLERLGLKENTIVVLFGDHGEAFGGARDHHLRRHGTALYQHQVHVPVIVRVPGIAGTSIRQWASLSDLTPTMLGLLGQADPHRRLGRDLTPLLVGEPSDWPDVVYADLPASPKLSPPSRQRGVWSGDLALFWKPADGTIQVFDLVRDPDERKDVFDASNEQHAKLMGYLKSWDKRIDSFWGERAPTTTEVVDVVAAFPEATDRLIAAADEKATIDALKELIEIFRAPIIRWDPRNRRRLDADAFARLQNHSRKLLAESLGNAGIRDRVLLLLIFGGSPEDVPLLSRAMARMKRPSSALFAVAGFRASHGDETAKERLVELFEGLPIEHKIGMASNLALLGDARGVDILKGAFYSRRRHDVIAAIRGLGALGSSLPYEGALFNDDTAWRHDTLLGAVARVAVGDESSLGTAALFHTAWAGSEQTIETSMAELKRRLGARMERAAELSGIVYQARESLRYRRYADGLKALDAFKPTDDDLLGPLWWLKVRAAWKLGDEAGARAALTRFRAACSSDAELTKVADRVAPHLGAPPQPSRNELSVSVKVVSTDGKPRKGKVFLTGVELTNDGKSLIDGGMFPDSYRLGWAFVDEAGEVSMPRSSHYLPLGGILPGETLLLSILGEVPTRKGRYTTRLMIYDAPRLDAARSLIEGPPVNVE